MDFMISVPCITTATYTLIEIIKKCMGNNEKALKFLPLIALAIGAICGLVCYFFIPGIFEASNVVMAVIIGAASGLAATGVNQAVKQLTTSEDTDSKDTTEN